MYLHHNYPINHKPQCPFEQRGIKPIKRFYIPVKDYNGIPMDKYMVVTEGGKIYNQIMEGRDTFPNDIFVINSSIKINGIN